MQAPDSLTAAEFAELLAAERGELRQWLRDGLPHTGAGRNLRISWTAGTDWLLARGAIAPADSLATPPPAAIPTPPPTETGPAWQGVVRTLPEVANRFGVSVNAVRAWLRQGMPGRPGPRGRQEGEFPLADIARWLSGRRDGPEATTKHQAQTRLAEARASLVELEFRKRQGALLEADEVANVWRRHIHEARAQLDQLPARIASRLPTAVDRGGRAAVRADVESIIREACQTLAIALDTITTAPETPANGQAVLQAKPKKNRTTASRQGSGPRIDARTPKPAKRAKV